MKKLCGILILLSLAVYSASAQVRHSSESAWESRGYCSGLASSCFTIGVDSGGCMMQQGCFWDSLRSICDGREVQCDQLGDPVNCGFQRGCLWIVDRNVETCMNR